MLHTFNKLLSWLVIVPLVLHPTMATGDASIRLPSDLKVLLELEQRLVARKRNYSVGDIIPVRVWRDVVTQGQVVISAGTRAMLRVDSIKSPGIVGRKGKVVLGAVSTTAVDGTTINLDGGYNKQGKGRIALTASLGALLFWPALFIPGGPPKFPKGTIIDSYVSGSYQVALDGAADRPVIQLANLSSALEADIDYDKLLAQKKPKNFPLTLSVDESYTGQSIVVDSVNGNSVEPIQVSMDATSPTTAEISIKQLSKHFQKGINRFEVAYMDGDDRVAAEIIMEIQL